MYSNQLEQQKLFKQTLKKILNQQKKSEEIQPNVRQIE